jgi:hypothetical protein
MSPNVMEYRSIVQENRRRLEKLLKRAVTEEEYLLLLVRILRNVTCTNPTSIDDRIHSFFETYYPELALRMGPRRLAKHIAQRGSFARDALSDRWTPKDSIGAILDAEQIRFLDGIVSFFDAKLVCKRSTRAELILVIEERIRTAVRSVAPAMCATIQDDQLCARLIERAGGVSRIARHSSNYVQMLGAERSFFNSEKPKHGLIHDHASVRTATRPGRSARRLANAITLRAREDRFRCD